MLWRVQQDESQRMWSAERDAMFEQVEEYRQSLAQIQGAAHASPPAPALQWPREDVLQQWAFDPEAVTVPRLFVAGERVRISGLQKQQDLNGKEGMVLALQAHRVQVRVGQERIVSLEAEKPELPANVRSVPSVPVRHV